MTQHQTFRYIDIIDDVTNAYNHRYHRTIKMRPVDVTVENQSDVWHSICVPAWRNEAEVGNLVSEILTKIVIVAKFMAILIFRYLSLRGV